MCIRDRATPAAPIIAPTVAGLMIDAFGWNSLFYLVLVIMAISFVLCSAVFENVLEVQKKKFDVISFVESVFAFGGVTLGVGNLSSFGPVSYTHLDVYKRQGIFQGHQA